MYHVIASGSTGNAVLYFDCVLVDVGVPYKDIAPFVKQIQLVLLTHAHVDHLNLSTLKRIVSERPSLRVGYCEWLADQLGFVRNLDVYDIGGLYDYGQFSICPVQLYHDVPNCGYRIFKGDTRIIHRTDTAHLEGITAKNYDLYAIEHNYDEETVVKVIADKTARGEFAYQKGAINTHLSEQAAHQFIFENAGPHSKVLRLHESKIIK